MSLPSGARAITISTVTFSRPMIRSIHSPLNTPGSPQSKPSSARNRTVSSRSSTTRPMWTKLVTPGRRPSIEVKPLARDRALAEVDPPPPWAPADPSARTGRAGSHLLAAGLPRRSRVRPILARMLARKEVLDFGYAVPRALGDRQEVAHRRDLLDLLGDEPLHELLGGEVTLVPRGRG